MLSLSKVFLSLASCNREALFYSFKYFIFEYLLLSKVYDATFSYAMELCVQENCSSRIESTLACIESERKCVVYSFYCNVNIYFLKAYIDLSIS